MVKLLLIDDFLDIDLRVRVDVLVQLPINLILSGSLLTIYIYFIILPLLITNVDDGWTLNLDVFHGPFPMVVRGQCRSLGDGLKALD